MFTLPEDRGSAYNERLASSVSVSSSRVAAAEQPSRVSEFRERLWNTSRHSTARGGHSRQYQDAMNEAKMTSKGRQDPVAGPHQRMASARMSRSVMEDASMRAEPDNTAATSAARMSAMARQMPAATQQAPAATRQAPVATRQAPATMRPAPAAAGQAAQAARLSAWQPTPAARSMPRPDLAASQPVLSTVQPSESTGPLRSAAAARLEKEGMQLRNKTIESTIESTGSFNTCQLELPERLPQSTAKSKTKEEAAIAIQAVWRRMHARAGIVHLRKGYSVFQVVKNEMQKLESEMGPTVFDLELSRACKLVAGIPTDLIQFEELLLKLQLKLDCIESLGPYATTIRFWRKHGMNTSNAMFLVLP